MLPAMHQAWAETTGALWSSRTIIVKPFGNVVSLTSGGIGGIFWPSADPPRIGSCAGEVSPLGGSWANLEPSGEAVETLMRAGLALNGTKTEQRFPQPWRQSACRQVKMVCERPQKTRNRLRN